MRGVHRRHVVAVRQCVDQDRRAELVLRETEAEARGRAQLLVARLARERAQRGEHRAGVVREAAREEAGRERVPREVLVVAELAGERVFVERDQLRDRRLGRGRPVARGEHAERHDRSVAALGVDVAARERGQRLTDRLVEVGGALAERERAGAAQFARAAEVLDDGDQLGHHRRIAREEERAGELRERRRRQRRLLQLADQVLDGGHVLRRLARSEPDRDDARGREVGMGRGASSSVSSESTEPPLRRTRSPRAARIPSLTADVWLRSCAPPPWSR